MDEQNYNKVLLEIIVDLKNYYYSEKRFSLKEIIMPARPKQSNSKQTKKNKDSLINSQLDREENLLSIKEQVLNCKLCNLSQTRTNAVFGSGSFNSKVVIIGEAPGGEEDKQGIPFVGRAGKLLDKMLSAIKLKREDVFICNILKCRPPDNRNPQPDEIEACVPYLNAQLKLIDPKIIFTLGNFATKFMLKTNEGITKLRGKLYSIDNYTVLPSYHPSALLRRASLKKDAWEDLKLLKSIIDSE